MKGRNLEENAAVRSLSRKGCKIIGKTINTSSSKNMGSSSWGLVDFLVNYKGYNLKEANTPEEAI